MTPQGVNKLSCDLMPCAKSAGMLRYVFAFQPNPQSETLLLKEIVENAAKAIG
jgi:hypothetical protein